MVAAKLPPGHHRDVHRPHHWIDGTTFAQLREDQIVITTEALSQIEDTDFAAESAEFALGRVLSQASMMALAFSNREQAEQLQEILDGLEQSPRQ
jgi:flagellin-like protein